MRLKYLISLSLLSTIMFGQTKTKLNQWLIDNPSEIYGSRAIFATGEIIQIYKKDTTFISKLFNYSVYKNKEGKRYIYNLIVDLFYKKLLDIKNETNEKIVDEIIKKLKYDKNYTKPDVDWGRVHSNCAKCPFGDSPPDYFFYQGFTVIHMGIEELQPMIDYENKQQWKYFLDDLQYGDVFSLTNPLNRRVFNHIIAKWKHSKNKDIQELVTRCRKALRSMKV